MGAMSGLVALLSLTGCDKNENTIITACDVGNLQVRAVYHQLNSQNDFISFDFYAKERLVTTMTPRGFPMSYVYCNDGRMLNVETTSWNVPELVVTSPKTQ